MATIYDMGQGENSRIETAKTSLPQDKKCAFHVIHNKDNWEQCVLVRAEDYKEGFTYQDYRNAGYLEAGISPIDDIK